MAFSRKTLLEVDRRLKGGAPPLPYLTSGGLLSPEGKLHLCGFQDHILLAQRICKGRSENTDYLARLLDLGWIALTRWNDTKEVLANRMAENPPTVTQNNVLKEILDTIYLNTDDEYELIWDVSEDHFDD